VWQVIIEGEEHSFTGDPVPGDIITIFPAGTNDAHGLPAAKGKRYMVWNKKGDVRPIVEDDEQKT